jgi:23S rRNA pseudouridine1911/1915/1917 synthase
MHASPTSADASATAAPDDFTEGGETLEIVLAPSSAGQRLDKALALAAPSLSRARLRALIDGGAVAIGGATIKDADRTVKGGEIVHVAVPAAAPALPRAQDIPLDIVHEDEALIVLNKPPGLVVHPAAGHAEGTLVNALLAHCGASLSGIGGVKRPGIVHRIDKETSGLLVVAKTDQAHRSLAKQLQARTLSRTYAAIVWGVPKAAEGTIERAIGRSPTNRKMMAVRPEGKPAVTHYTVKERFGLDASLLECRLETGRTHQIRVHLTALGHPLIGDPVYGGGLTGRRKALAARIPAVGGFRRQALHAAELRFQHPVTHKNLRFSAPLPPDMAALLKALRAGGPPA